MSPTEDRRVGPTIRYGILGPFDVSCDARTLTIGGGKQRAVLALLVMHAGEIVSVDAMIDELWGDEQPDGAENVVQVYVSRLRKSLEGKTGRSGVLVTRKPGYMLMLGPTDQIDARSYERAVADARAAASRGDHEHAVRAFAAAEDLWRGAPLADFAFDRFAQREIQRLTELHLQAIEDRLGSELALGRGAEMVATLQDLVMEHPLRERLRAALMLALYRAGRQADALAVYRDARRTLNDELGIDPGPALRHLERDILAHDPSLLPASPHAPALAPELPEPERAILVTPRDPARLDGLIALTEPLARAAPAHEIILVRLLGPWERNVGDLREASDELRARSDALAGRGVASRAVAFTSRDAAADLSRLASEHPVALLLFDVEADASDPDATPVLEQVECDVASVIGADRPVDPSRSVVVPFGGTDDDWAALELAAGFAKTRGSPLRLLGSVADEGAGMRDASRLLASASLVVQRMTRVVAEPVLVEPGEGVARAARDAGLIVLGVSGRWRTEGFGELRATIARSAVAPVVILRRGTTKTGLGARTDQTRYAWSRAPG